MRPLLLGLLVVISGCSIINETECHADAARWTWHGEYDAVQGDQPWIWAYAKACSRFGATVDEDDYLKGWDIGHAAFERRVNIAN